MRPDFFIRLFRLSRPRFWMYAFGPFIVGALVGAQNPRDYLSSTMLAWAVFFLFSANLLIYGVNDVFDYETDRLNAKKRGYEDLVPPDQRRQIAIATLISCAPWLFLVPSLPRPCLWALAGFLFFSIFYSAPPIRAKAKPILDAAFNVLYIFPGAFGYFLAGGQNFSPQLFIAAWAWAMAMHAYSAVPDISADREANVPTVATFLGLRTTLIFCWTLYLSSALLAFWALGWFSIALGMVYSVLMFRSLHAGTEAGVMKIYRAFPLINTLVGGAIWWFVALQKPTFWPF